MKLFRSKLVVLVVAVIFVAMPLAGYVSLARAEFVVEPQLINIETPLSAETSIPWPEQGVAAIGADGFGPLTSSGQSDSPRPIASITKLFTAWAILDKKPLAPGASGDTITFTAQDAALVSDYRARGGAVAPVQAGQQLTQYQAMKAMLIPSANNMADTLAVWAFGSMDAYLDYVNNLVQKEGLAQTTIADASGFSPDSVSSPSDLIKLADIVLDMPVLADIISQPSATLPGVGTVYSTNKLLGQQGIVGGKTGNTDEAGDCFLFMSEYETAGNEVTIIGVMLDQSHRPETFAHSTSIITAARKGFGEVELLQAGDQVGHYHTDWGATAPVEAAQDIDIFTWLGSIPEPEIWLEDVPAGLPAEEQVGSVTATAGEHVYNTPATLSKPLPAPSMTWRLKNSVGLD